MNAIICDAELENLLEYYHPSNKILRFYILSAAKQSQCLPSN